MPNVCVLDASHTNATTLLHRVCVCICVYLFVYRHKMLRLNYWWPLSVNFSTVKTNRSCTNTRIYESNQCGTRHESGWKFKPTLIQIQSKFWAYANVVVRIALSVLYNWILTLMPCQLTAKRVFTPCNTTTLCVFNGTKMQGFTNFPLSMNFTKDSQCKIRIIEILFRFYFSLGSTISTFFKLLWLTTIFENIRAESIISTGFSVVDSFISRIIAIHSNFVLEMSKGSFSIMLFVGHDLHCDIQRNWIASSNWCLSFIFLSIEIFYAWKNAFTLCEICSKGAYSTHHRVHSHIIDYNCRTIIHCTVIFGH